MNITFICTWLKPNYRNSHVSLYFGGLEGNIQYLEGMSAFPSLSSLPGTEATLGMFWVCQFVFFRLLLICNWRWIFLCFSQILSLITADCCRWSWVQGWMLHLEGHLESLWDLCIFLRLEWKQKFATVSEAPQSSPTVSSVWKHPRLPLKLSLTWNLLFLAITSPQVDWEGGSDT